MNERRYGSVRKVMIFLIISIFISSSYAFDFSQFQWGTGVSGKLQRGEVLVYVDYSVKVVAFPPPVESDKYKKIPGEAVEPFVGLNISKNDSFIGTALLGPGDSYILPDGELRVRATNLPSRYAAEWLFESYSPWATIELSPRGKPDLEVSIDTNNNEYTSSSTTEIVAIVTLRNNGWADALDVDINIDTELPIKRGNLKYHYDQVKKGETITNTITFSSPVLAEKKSYGISANISGYDVKDIFYNSKFQKSISITPQLLKIPSLKKSSNAKIYLSDYAMVSLSFKNNENYDLKNVSIADSIPDSFKLVGNNSLHWVVDIPAYGEWDYRYLIKPHEPNKDGIVFPSATAEFWLKNEYYMVQSNQPAIVVYGPKIMLDKQTDLSEINPGDTVTVTITAENIGSTPTKVFIKDGLPDDVTIISGKTTHEEYLESNKGVSFSYILKIDSIHPVTLPPATAEYYELGTKGDMISTASQVLEIKIKTTIYAAPTPEIITPPPVTEILAPTPIIIESDVSNNSGCDVNRTDEPDSVRQSNEIYGILNFLLGCNNDSTNDRRSNATYYLCKLFQES